MDNNTYSSITSQFTQYLKILHAELQKQYVELKDITFEMMNIQCTDRLITSAGRFCWSPDHFRIENNSKIVFTGVQLLLVLFHEYCHAILKFRGLKTGKDYGTHDRYFLQLIDEMNCRYSKYIGQKISVSHDMEIKTYELKCTKCYKIKKSYYKKYTTYDTICCGKLVMVEKNQRYVVILIIIILYFIDNVFKIK